MRLRPLAVMKTRFHSPLRRLLLGAALAAGAISVQAKDVTLLNVSYDPTRELYADFNKAFAAHWKAKTGDVVTVKQSHGGSSKQAAIPTTQLLFAHAGRALSAPGQGVLPSITPPPRHTSPSYSTAD
jgi:hypothetical protein